MRTRSEVPGTLLLGILVALAACAPKRVHEEPIIDQGNRVEDPAGVAQSAGAGSGVGTSTAARDSLAAAALAGCEGEVCDAIVRGEVVPGMTVEQVLAASRTTADAWSIRSAGDSRIMAGRSFVHPPRDAAGEIALVQLRDGRVARLSYREPEGIRLVRSPGDRTTDARARARAETLVREGDDLAAIGRLDDALDRYDRAAVLTDEMPELDFRIATILDRRLRPLEALIHYQLFLHRMELERIEARGDAYAKLADAIARARERIIVLERQVR